MRLRHFPVSLTGAKVRLGLLLGYCAVLAVAAVVDPPWRSQEATSDASSLHLRAADLADSLLGSAEGSWAVVADIGTPWGRSIRIRPNVDQIEIRGCDLVVQEATSPRPRTAIPNGFFYPADPSEPGEAGSSAMEPSGSSAIDRPVSGSAAKDSAAEQSSPVSLSHVEEALIWRHKPLSIIERERIARCAAVIEGSGSSLADTGVISLRWIAQRNYDGTWRFWAEGMLDSAQLDSSSANPSTLDPSGQTDSRIPDEAAGESEASGSSSPWASLPWSTAVPPHDIAIPVQLRIDPDTGTLLEIRDARFLAETVGEALLFDPNPVAASGLPDLRDGNAVDAYRQWVSLPRLNGTGKLRGSWVETRSDRPPIADEQGLVFDYPSYDPRFEEAMAYYHVDRGIERVEQRGFGGLFSSPIFARVHGTAADNSWYSRPSRELVFGDGGVDDAEDADIILHELGHAIHDALVPGFGDGDTRAISEGFADFWAASLTGEPCIGDWDATSYSPPCLRSTENAAVYPASLTGRSHADGQIWSGVLWDLRVSLGEDAAEQLALAAFLEQDPETTWPDAAESLVRAASRTGDSEQLERVVDALVRRGLLARELSVHLEPGRDWTLGFLSPAKFLDQPVGSIRLAGDGTIGFAIPGSPFLESAPAVVAAGLGEVDNAPPGLALDCAVRIDAGLVTIHQTWRVSTTELVAVLIEWDTVSGALSWTYERALEGTDALGLFAGAASVPQSDPVGIDWAKLPSDGVDGILSCHGPIESVVEMIGARFTVTPESSPHFRLARTGQPRPSGSGPLLVAFPNPGRGETAVRLFLDQSAVADVALFDSQGRRVRELSAPGMLTSGLSEWLWDGRDDHGRLLPSGRYWARASVPTGTARIPVVLIR